MAPLKATIQLMLGTIGTWPSQTIKQQAPCHNIHTVDKSTANGPSLAAISWGPNRMDVFGEHPSSGNVTHKYWGGEAWGPSVQSIELLGGNYGGPPAAVSRNTSLLDVFIVDNTKNLLHKYWDGFSWQPAELAWEQLSDSTTLDQTIAPAVSSWAPSRMDVFARGADKSLYHKYFDGSAWKPDNNTIENLSGSLSSGVAAISWGSNRIDVFAVATSSSLVHLYWTGDKWSDWEDLGLGSTFSATPAAVSWEQDRFDVFAVNTEGNLIHIYWNGGKYTDENLGGSNLTGTPAATSWGVGRIDVVALGQDGQYYYIYLDGGSWSSWASKGGNFTSAPSAVSWDVNRLDIYGVDADDQLGHQTWWGQDWYPSFGGWETLGGPFEAYSH